MVKLYDSKKRTRRAARGMICPADEAAKKEQKFLLPNQLLLNYFTSFSGFCSLVILSQLWLPTVQLVLHADWQVDLHSPQAVIFLSAGLAIVLIILQSPY